MLQLKVNVINFKENRLEEYIGPLLIFTMPFTGYDATITSL